MTQDATIAQEQFGPGFGRDAVYRLSELKREPEWLRARRLEAWEAYERLPAPSSHERPWKYTDLTSFDFTRFSPYAEPDTELLMRLDGYRDEREARIGLLVQGDSRSVFGELNDDAAAKGVVFCSLDEAVRLYPDLVRERLMAGETAPPANKLTALHGAFWSGGTFVYVPRDVEVVLPLHSVLEAQTAGLAVFPHTLVVTESGSRVTLIDEYVSPQRAGFAFCDAVSELIVGDGAQVRYVHLQRWDTGTYHFSAERASLGRDASLSYVTVGLGSRLSKTTSDTVLAGAGAQSEMLGLFFGERGQKFDAVTLQEHRGPHTKSDLLFKSALKDRAQSVYYGVVRVNPDARGTDANQENRNLLLSEQAKADSDPVLEILTSEVVRCGHGATVGPVDEDQLFYLQCRGLTREQAEQMLVAGFFSQVIERVPVVQVRSRIERAILERLQA